MVANGVFVGTVYYVLILITLKCASIKRLQDNRKQIISNLSHYYNRHLQHDKDRTVPYSNLQWGWTSPLYFEKSVSKSHNPSSRPYPRSSQLNENHWLTLTIKHYTNYVMEK
jgi:hypothetical protein